MTDPKLSRYFFIALLLGTAVVFFRMLQVFFMPVLLAAVFATLFYPMYLRFLSACRGRKTLAAFFCCLALLILLIVPLYLVADLVTHEAIDFYRSTQAHLGDVSQQIQGPLD
ncbi:MAG TPA: AI-2E family transporter, partial [Thermoanaerobaculia bacterium]